MLYIHSFPICSFSTGSCVALGTFDGVHRGHHAVLKHLAHLSIASNLPAIVCTFTPHPRSIVHSIEIPLLSTLEEREELILTTMNTYTAGKIPVYVVFIPFTKELATISAQNFIESILQPFCLPQSIVLGENAYFGNDAGKSLKQYSSLIKRIPSFLYQNNIVSSTSIRNAIAQGDMKYATYCLNRYVSFEGRVVHGYKRGSTLLGFPTANITIPETALPEQGVYAVHVIHNTIRYKGVLNIGMNPTFSGKELSIEVHILDFDLMIYGDLIRIECINKLRNEACFSSVLELITQIKMDIAHTRDSIEL